MRRALVRVLLLVSAVSISLPGFSDLIRLRDGREITGQYEGGSARVVRFRTNAGVMEYDVLEVSQVWISGAATSVFRPDTAPMTARGRVAVFDADQERLIREWFRSGYNQRDLPPGLSRRRALPPGLARHIEKNGTLPRGLERRIEPLPRDLQDRLPRLDAGFERVILGGDVLLIEIGTSRILDLLKNVV